MFFRLLAVTSVIISIGWTSASADCNTGVVGGCGFYPQNQPNSAPPSNSFDNAFGNAAGNIFREWLRQNESTFVAVVWAKRSNKLFASHGARSLDGAKSHAIRDCQNANYEKCQLLAWARNACTSIVETVDSNPYDLYYSWGNDHEAAFRNSMEECSRVGRRCEFRYSVCTDGSTR